MKNDPPEKRPVLRFVVVMLILLVAGRRLALRFS